VKIEGQQKGSRIRRIAMPREAAGQRSQSQAPSSVAHTRLLSDPAVHKGTALCEEEGTLRDCGGS
jgi:hypothetical protein